MTAAVPVLSALSDDETQILTQLRNELQFHRFQMELRNAYYNGEQRIAQLGIAVPPNLQRLRAVVGWPRLVVDSLDERLDVEGFRAGSGADTDPDLWDIWQANDLDLESQLGRIDALIYGSSYLCVGSPDEDGDPPIITVESPLHIACQFDPRTKAITAALRVWTDGVIEGESATLYLPDQTISLEHRFQGSPWGVVDRDDHGLGQVPVVRMSNRARLTERRGYSEITPELISVTDAACRSMLSLAVAGEFYSAPQRYVLGAKESAFQNADGTPRTGWESYLGRFLMIERDNNAELPTVGQFTAYDPSTYTKVIDEYAQIVAAITGLPAEYLGITTSNPASADAIRMTTDRLVTKAKRKQRSFECAYEDAMRLALMIQNGSGDIDPEYQSMETLWRDPAIATPAATSDAITKQVQEGILPATSIIALQRLGYSPAEIEIIVAERKTDAATLLLQQVATNLETKLLRADSTVTADLAPPKPAPGQPAAPAAPATPPATPAPSGNGA